jgi:hypothetical protein
MCSFAHALITFPYSSQAMTANLVSSLRKAASTFNLIRRTSSFSIALGYLVDKHINNPLTSENVSLLLDGITMHLYKHIKY